MKFKSLLSGAFSTCLGIGLLLSVGCGESEPEPSAAGVVSAGEVTQWQAKAAEGDGQAALKVGQFYSNSAKNDTERQTALKWFYIAEKLGETTAKLGAQAVERQLDSEARMAAKLEANKFKLPDAE